MSRRSVCLTTFFFVGKLDLVINQYFVHNQHKNQNYVIITSLNRETIGKLINRIPGSRLLISSLPGAALRTRVELLGKPQTSVLKVLPGKLDIKRHSPSILYRLFQNRIYYICSKILNTSCLPKRPRQTVQTQIRLLLKKQSDQGLPCLLF